MQMNIFGLMNQTTNSIPSQMENLVQELNQASKAYYSEDTEVMSNKQYDEKFDTLVQMEKSTGIILPNSPTQNVGYEAVSELQKVTHEVPALSLDKTKLIDDLVTFLDNKEGVLSWKMDGLTLQVTYENGKLVRAVTRGNGKIGEDVTHNTPVIAGLPLQIPYTKKLIVRGEVVISYNDFNKINEELVDREPYTNPRNLTSGSLRLMDVEEAKKRCMAFKCFELVQRDGEIPDDIEESFEFLRMNQFNIVEYMVIREDTVSSLEDAIENGVACFQKLLKSGEYPYPTDGLVLTYKDAQYGHSLGQTGHHPKHSMAFKWQDTTVPTTLRAIEWNASKTGRLNPVALFDTVELEGTNVSRASVHNLSVMDELGLSIGAEIQVFKANMIIPQIAECDGLGTPVMIPDTCPVCGGATRIKITNETKVLVCENPLCAAKHVGRFTRMVERDALNVVGLAQSQISKFIENGWLQQPADLFYLKEHKKEIINMDGFGEKSYTNIVDAIDTARHTTFRQFFYSLGIEGAGSDVAKILDKNLSSIATRIGSTQTKKSAVLLELMTEVPDATLYLKQLDGIGDVTAQIMSDWFEKYQVECEKYHKELFITDDEFATCSNSVMDLEGLVFVVTGSLNTYSNRDELKTEIESRGGKVTGSVSAKTSYLINNDLTSTSGKNKKAKELGIPIISEAEYKTL